jgi:transposase-like protein
MKKRKHSKEFKARVAIEALKNEKTMAELSSEFEINSNLISKWKKQLLQNLPDLFGKPLKVGEDHFEKEKEELFKEIGKLKVENEFLKKKYKQLYG